MTKKKYLYEVDLMRCFFIFGVLLNHTTSLFSSALGQTSTSSGKFLVSTHLMLHFPRMGFMFVTGLVLFLQYYDRPNVNYWEFWKKRYKGSGIPYIFFNGFYMLCALLLAGTFSFGLWGKEWFLAMIRGDHYYLYYILVIFQLYLIFPVLVWMFKKLEDHHEAILLVSAILQVILLIYAKYIYPNISHQGWPYFAVHYGNLLLTYQFYFIAGAYTWIHYADVQKLLLRHQKLIFITTIILSLGTLALYHFNVAVLHLPQHNANLIHQPYMFFYAVFVISSIIIICLKYTDNRTKPTWRWFSRLVEKAAKVSFGIYLLQTIPLLFLTGILNSLKTQLSSSVLLALLPVGYFFVLGISWLIAEFCLKVPPFGALIGRPNHHQLLKRKDLKA